VLKRRRRRGAFSAKVDGGRSTFGRRSAMISNERASANIWK
jgi:hypothetical protein